MATVYYRFALRSYTAAEFAAMNDILLDRELGVESDTGRGKRGDGTTPWNDLPYEVLGLGEVDWTGLADGDTLLFDATANVWKPGPPGTGGGGGGSSDTPPLSTNFTSFGTGITVTDKSDRMQLAVTSGGVLRGITQNLPSAPYTIDARMTSIGAPVLNDSYWAGIHLSDGTVFKALYLGAFYGSTANVIGLRAAIDQWSTSTSYQSTSLNINIQFNPADYWVRITDNGTTRTYLISGNGKDYVPIFSEATNTGVTATKCGLAVYNSGLSSLTAKVSVSNWLVSSSVLGDAA